MRKRVVVGVGLLAVLIAAVTAWWLRTNQEDRPPTVARKRGARIDFRMPRQPETPATLSGLVTRKSDGQPIPHAVVSITWVGEIVAPDDMRPLVITTNADGQWATREVPPGDYVIAANAVGFAPAAREENDIKEGEQRAELELSLDSGGVAVTGMIAAEDRNRVANARITARVTGKRAAFAAMSDAGGRYQLGLAAGTYRIEVEHDDYQRIHRSIEVEQTPLTSDFVLVRGGVIRGRVIASDTHQPVADVIVQAMGRETFAAAQSAEDGTFTLRSLGTGMVMVYARGRSHAAREPKTFELEVGERLQDVQLTVDPAFSISGRVVAHGDPRQGIAGVKVSVLPSSGMMWPLSTLTDGDGAFEVVGLAAGQQQLVAEKGTLLTSTPREVEIIDKDVFDVTIEMKTGVLLSGRIEPPTIAQIAIAKPGAWMGTEDENTISLVRAKTESDAAGAFTLRNIPMGSFEVTAMAKDGATGKLLVNVTGADQSNLIVRLSPRASISGRVVDTRGKPVANVYVFPNRADVPMAKRFERDGIYRGATTAADGSFKLVGLEGGTWQLSVVEQRSSNGPKFDVDVDEGAHRTGVTLTIDARDAQIRGTVLGVDRNPAAGAQVRALQEVTENSRRRLAAEGEPVGTKQDGSFVIEKLRSGSYTLAVDGPGGTAKASARGVKTGETVAITLEPAASLTIKVTQNGSPAKNVMLQCEGPSGRYGIGAENVVGFHTFARLAPGEYRCQATVENAGASGTVTMRGQAAVLELALEAAEFGSLVGVVVSALDGAPIADAVIMAAGEGARTDANGRFVVDRVAAGDGVMLLQPKDDASYPPIKHSYTAKARERVDVGTIKILPPRKGDVGTFGLTLAVRDAVLAVTRVKPKSPAQREGIRVGDTISSVDGHAVSTLGPERAIQLLVTDYVSVGDTRVLMLGRGTRVTLTAVKW